MHALFLASGLLIALADEVIGDRALLAMVHAARDANIARFPSGSLKATYEMKSTAAKEHIRGIVHLRWTPTVAFAERWESMKGELPSTQSPPVRFLFEPSRVARYAPEAGLHGGLFLEDPQRAERFFLLKEFIDLRPTKRWNGIGPKRYLEFLRFDAPMAGGREFRWVLSTVGEEVHIQRTAKVSEKNIGPVYRFSVHHGGLLGVTQSPQSGFAWFTSHEQEWARHVNGGYWLARHKELHRDAKGSEAVKILVVEEFSASDPEPFSFDSLQVRKGAMVSDEIKKTRYTYTAKPVLPAALKKLGDKVASEGAAVPKKE